MGKPAWSYSLLTAFETCPKRFELTKITKQVVEPQTEATLWGNRVHAALEHRVGKGTPLPTGMEKFEPVAAKLVAAGVGGKVEVEQKLALNQNYAPTTWFGKDVWVRSIADLMITKRDKCLVVDHKTGRVKPDSAQLKLTAAMAFAHKPYIQKVTTTFIWLAHDQITSASFERKDVPDIWQEFLPRVKRMEIAIEKNKFPPNPSGLCRNYCPCTGCEFNGRYTGGK